MEGVVGERKYLELLEHNKSLRLSRRCTKKESRGKEHGSTLEGTRFDVLMGEDFLESYETWRTVDVVR